MFIGDRNEMIFAIIGRGFCGNYRLAQKYTDLGLARFTGNQHNPEGIGLRLELEKLKTSKLEEIGEELKRN